MAKLPPPSELEDRLVRSIVEQELSDLQGLWQGVVDEEHNVFLTSVSPTLAVASKLTRRLTSRLGRKLARMARGLAKARFGASAVPSDVASSHLEVAWSPNSSRSDDTFIHTDFDYDELTRLTLWLVDQAGGGARVGTPKFRAMFRNSQSRLIKGKRAAEAWSVQVDLAVLHPSVGLAELESGGNLDSSNAIGQSRKLIRAGLALGDSNLPLHFCTAYANRGEGRRIQGSLGKYFEQGSDQPDGLLVGSEWWERILPERLSFDDFLAIFHEVAVAYEIIPSE